MLPLPGAPPISSPCDDHGAFATVRRIVILRTVGDNDINDLDDTTHDIVNSTYPR
jgi:hypothetical protein